MLVVLKSLSLVAVANDYSSVSMAIVFLLFWWVFSVLQAYRYWGGGFWKCVRNGTIGAIGTIVALVLIWTVMYFMIEGLNWSLVRIFG